MKEERSKRSGSVSVGLDGNLAARTEVREHVERDGRSSRREQGHQGPVGRVGSEGPEAAGRRDREDSLAEHVAAGGGVLNARRGRRRLHRRDGREGARVARLRTDRVNRVNRERRLRTRVRRRRLRRRGHAGLPRSRSCYVNRVDQNLSERVLLFQAHRVRLRQEEQSEKLCRHLQMQIFRFSITSVFIGASEFCNIWYVVSSVLSLLQI